jgi:calcineurin-like phosphoesterase family protein
MIYFSSDHHFGHSNIIKYCNRPYSSVEEMNEKLIENWNATVKPEDTVYYLGDFSLSTKPVKEITPKLNGHKLLIPGNHDFCHLSHSKSKTPEKHEKCKKIYEDSGWTRVCRSTGEIFCSTEPEHLIDIGLGRSKILYLGLNHFPFPFSYVNDGRDFSKYQMNSESICGSWLLHGHVHNLWKVKDKMINVGVDVWDYKPVSVDQIMEILLKAEGRK